MKIIIVIFLSILNYWLLNGQKTHELNINVPDEVLRYDHLKLGGSNPAGEKITANNYYLEKNGQPFIPIAGEFHFPRYPKQYWDESIKKMKAGGINIIATYVFWNIHEEKEGQFDWSEDRNLREFVELCAKNDVYCIIRIGPFCHGEIRNGGLPDWLLGRPLTIRSNDPVYLAYVDKFYTEIGRQLKGLYYKDGGNIIGIQLENEYQHSAAPWGLTYPGQPYDWTAAEQDQASTHQGVSTASGENPYSAYGDEHMKILKSMAVKAGMETPLYTATGWGYAAVIENEALPVTGAYAYPFWTEKKDLSPFFLYKDLHKFPDYLPVRYNPLDYPSFSAELGSGIMSVYTRRPIVDQKSMDALINRCLGSGSNGLGYYMYHGGSTPRGKTYFLADEAYGLPKISYDFQAPIGEFGQIRTGFHRLKLLHFFLRDFEEVLAPMSVALPANVASLSPDSLSSLRYAARVKNGSGFLFLNNFQDDADMLDLKKVQVVLKTGSKDIPIPESGGFDLKSGENAVFPFNFNISGVNQNYATAQLYLKGNDPAQPYLVFFAPEGVAPEFSFQKGEKVEIKNSTGCEITENKQRILVRCQEKNMGEFLLIHGKTTTKVLVISKEMALNSWPVTFQGKKHLIFSEAVILQNGETFEIQHKGNNTIDFSIYPSSEIIPRLNSGTISRQSVNSLLTSWRIILPEVNLTVKTREIGPKKFAVTLPATMPTGLSNLWLTVTYTGDTAMGFLDGQLVTDEFYKGFPWEIGLRRFYPDAAGKEMVFYFRPLQKGATYLADLLPEDVPDFGNKREILEVKVISVTPEYRCIVSF